MARSWAISAPAASQPSILVVSEEASVTGQIHADHVIINGRVKGPVHALELLELQPKARIEGDVSYKALEMHQGATIAGQLKPMVGELEDKAHTETGGKQPLKASAGVLGYHVFHG